MLTTMNVAWLILRLVVGLLFAGHGAQKLFAWFGGRGLTGHAAMLEKMGVHPARFWAWINALSEFLGGLGLALGLLTPLAAAMLIGSMLVAIIKVHWAKGLWNTNGGFELPLVLAMVAFIIGLAGPGVYSLDQILGLTLPEPVIYVVALVVMLIGVIGVLMPIQPLQRHGHQTR
jgi:putative oxidoreductase